MNVEWKVEATASGVARKTGPAEAAAVTKVEARGVKREG